MKIQSDALMKNYTTLRLGGSVPHFAVVTSDVDLFEAIKFAYSKNLPVFPLGGGSNLVISDELKDMFVVKMENSSIHILSEDENIVTIRVGAGTIWNNFVEYTVSNKFAGIEALAMIPGTCGASPVQNIGAYGQEVSDTIESVRIYDLELQDFREILARDCNFSYRNSIFKNELKGKCVIESVIFTLKKSEPIIPNYPRVADVLEEIRTQNSTDTINTLILKSIRKIRSEKLPDPKVIANVGSFFKNAFVSVDNYKKLLQKYPDMPYFISGDMYKIPAGWLVEKAGYKGYNKNGVGVYEKNALVLINISSQTSATILDLAKQIQVSIQEKFNILLEIEPEIVI